MVSKKSAFPILIVCLSVGALGPNAQPSPTVPAETSVLPFSQEEPFLCQGFYQSEE